MQRAQALLSRATDLLHQLRVRAQKLAKGVARQHEEPAIAECDHIGDARSAHDQRHLTEELPGAEPHHLILGALHLDRTRGDEVHGITTLAAADDPLAGQSEARHQQRLQVGACRLVQFA